MSEFTTFAGLYKLDPGDPVSLNNYEFYENESILDNYIYAFLNHRHNGAPAMANFASAATLTASASGGLLPPSETYYIGITAVDQYGGETTAQISSATTAATVSNPTTAPTAIAGSGGSLNAGAYRYGYTIVDAAGETEISPQVTVTIGNAGKATVTLPVTTPNNKRLYRAFGFSDFNKVADVAGSSTVFVDDGTLCVSCDQAPPDENTAGSTNRITVTRPALPASASYWRIYVSQDPSLSSPAALFAYGSANLRNIPSAASAVDFTTEAGINQGSPPPVSRTIPGASQIFATDVFYQGNSPYLGSGSVEDALDSLSNSLVSLTTKSIRTSNLPLASAASGEVIFASAASGVAVTQYGMGSAARFEWRATRLASGSSPPSYSYPKDIFIQDTNTVKVTETASANGFKMEFERRDKTVLLTTSFTPSPSSSSQGLTYLASGITFTLPSGATDGTEWTIKKWITGAATQVNVTASAGIPFEGVIGGTIALANGTRDSLTVRWSDKTPASGYWVV